MSDFDPWDLDGHLLRLFLAVLEEGGITRAAQRLEVTQSAVSHGLDKLRGIVGDALFVKSGRGIVPTAQARALAPRARRLLDDLQAFGAAAAFDPARLDLVFTIAANDLQRDLLLPPLLRTVRRQAPGFRLRVIPSGAPSAEMLREAHCQLILTPRPPDGTDILQKRLFEDRYRVFYDAAARPAPRTLAEYLAAEHVTVLYEPRRRLDIDDHLLAQGVERRFAAQVPGFGGIGPFLAGGPLLATLPGLLGATPLLRGFARVAPPVACPTMPMYLVWHLRHQADPTHRWLREQVLAVAARAVAAVAPDDVEGEGQAEGAARA